MKSKEKFKEYYKNDHVTSTYDEQREGTDYRKKKRERELSKFLRLVDKKENDKILELGCSSGFLTKHLGKVTAIDTSSGMLKITQEKNPEAEVMEMDMFNIDKNFQEMEFDKIVTIRVWTHLNREEIMEMLRKSRKILKDNGEIIFDIEDRSMLRRFVRFFYKYIFQTTGFYTYQFSLYEINKMLESEGFVLVDKDYLNHKVGRQILIKAKKTLKGGINRI